MNEARNCDLAEAQNETVMMTMGSVSAGTGIIADSWYWLIIPVPGIARRWTLYTGSWRSLVGSRYRYSSASFNYLAAQQANPYMTVHPILYIHTYIYIYSTDSKIHVESL